MLLSPLTLILLEANRSTWKSADPVLTRMEATTREEVGCVVAVPVTRAAQEAAREEVILRRMEAAGATAADEEAVASRRLHDTLEKYPKRYHLFKYDPRESSNPYSHRILTLDTNIQRHQAVDSGTTF